MSTKVSKCNDRKTIVLIACSKNKLATPAKAKALYIGQLFRSSLAYARSLQPDAIYILSAHYGLVELNQRIEPYNLPILHLNGSERRVWAKNIASKLALKHDLANDKFIILAGDNYRRPIIEHLANWESPLMKLGIGEQLRFLASQVNKLTEEMKQIKQTKQARVA